MAARRSESGGNARHFARRAICPNMHRKVLRMRLPDPIPGRECGECTACCVQMSVDDPDLKKADNVACHHLVAGTGCGIHASRPLTCRTWFCGWRFLRLSDAMRPDRSRVLLAPEMGATPGYEKGGLRIILMQEDRDVLLHEELLSFIAKCVAGGVPIFLSWGDGIFAKRGLINEAAKQAVADGDKSAFIRILCGMLDVMAQQVAMEIITAQNRAGF